MQHIVSFLEHVPLFKPLPQTYKQMVAERFERIAYQPNQVIFREGSEDRSMYLVEQGEVSVVHEDELLGLHYEVAKLGPGQVFGEMAMLTQEKRSATCKASAPTVALVLSHEVFMALMQRVPQLSVELCQVLARRLAQLNKHHGQAVGAEQLQFDAELYKRFPARVLERHQLIPLRVRGSTMYVATPKTDNLLALDDLRRLIKGVEIQAVHISEEDYQKVLEKHLRATAEALAVAPPGASASVDAARGAARGRAATVAQPAAQPAARRIEYQAPVGETAEQEAVPLDKGDVVQLVNQILLDALEHDTSDIHIEPQGAQALVRYRVDGQLRVRDGHIPRAMLSPLVSRLKILAGADIAERRLPQDGRISFYVGPRPYELRLSVLPTLNGEKAVMRLLDTERGQRPLEEIIVAQRVCKLVQRMIHLPYGMVMVCGPTGSGKTTTLYAMLRQRSDGRQNITTIEDPVEYLLPNATQVQVRENIGLGYPQVLRSVLRQNPDVILLGEMRDKQTVSTALEASLMGHLLMTSFHADTAVGALIRLLDMGQDAFTVGHAINGILCQRLARRLCPACTEPHAYAPEIRGALERARIMTREDPAPLFRARGCDHCQGTGFRGRLAVFEVLSMTDPLRRAIAAGGTAEDLTRAASQGGFVARQRYASYLLQQGMTTPEELLRLQETADSPPAREP